MLKHYLRRACRPLWFWRRLPAQYGNLKVLVSPYSHMQYWTTPLEVVHHDLLKAVFDLLKPGQCFWDIGANMGVATFTAAHRVGASGYVLSVDGDTDLVNRLRRSATANAGKCSPVDVLPAAVTDKLGIAKFNLSDFSTATNSLDGFGRNFSGVLRSVSIPAVTLDWLSAQVRKPDVVKIDVEGAELLVLQGAAELLRDVRPVLILEVGSAVAESVTSLLKEAGYDIYNMETYERIDCAAFDIIAVPQEKSLSDWAFRS